MDSRVRMTFINSLCHPYQVSSVAACMCASLWTLSVVPVLFFLFWLLTYFFILFVVKSWEIGQTFSPFLPCLVLIKFLELQGSENTWQSSSCVCATFTYFLFLFCFFLVGAKEGGREMFDDPSYVNVDKPRLPAAANGNAHKDAFDMSKCLFVRFCWKSAKWSSNGLNPEH